MDIDLTQLVTNNVDVIKVDINVSYDEERLRKVGIRELNNTTFVGKIKKLYEGYEISGILKGVMILPDDITLEDVKYEFSIDILENFDEMDEDQDNNLIIINNNLDISDFLWQNIVLEIPLKVVDEKNKNITLEGDGWRFITEEELEKERSNESPFDELDSKFDFKEGDDKNGSSS
ncbi:MAG: YceD family protein [Bacilli bacterium]|nr:YceD family protein [Bacilli bacterium]